MEDAGHAMLGNATSVIIDFAAIVTTKKSDRSSIVPNVSITVMVGRVIRTAIDALANET